MDFFTVDKLLILVTLYFCTIIKSSLLNLSSLEEETQQCFSIRQKADFCSI